MTNQIYLKNFKYAATCIFYTNAYYSHILNQRPDISVR